MRHSSSKFIFFVASRYLISKKNQNAINIISLISILGVMISALSLVCVMSVFNGLVNEIEKSFSYFDSDLRVKSSTGKVFDYKDIETALSNQSSILYFTKILQENALISYYDNQTPFSMLGVDSNYNKVFELDSMMIEGNFRLHNMETDISIVGIGLASKLGLGIDYVNGITIYTPKREGRINIIRPETSFKQGELFVGGLFESHQIELDDNILIVPIEFTQDIYEYEESTVSSVCIKVDKNSNIKKVKKELQKAIGENYKVENRFEQQKDYFKIIKVEKLLIFLILTLMLFIAVCNIVGSLIMLLIEKKNDIKTLDWLGVKQRDIEKIFIVNGTMMSLVGAIIGIISGVILCILQDKFGFIKVSDASYLSSYPVAIKIIDIIGITITVITIGFISTLLTVKLYFRRTKR